MKTILIALAILVCLGSGVAAAATAAADTVTAPPSTEAWHLRGVTAPLSSHPTGGQSFLRTIGYVPYGLVELTGRPVYWLIQLDEKHHIVRRISRLFIWNVKPVDTRLSARFGYESGLGLTIIGLHAESSDWLGTGIDYGLTAGYLNPRNNIFSLYLHGREDNTWLSFLTRFERKDNRPFYGLGADSPNLRTDAHRQFVHNEVSLNVRPTEGWLVTTSLYQRHTDLDEPDEGLEDIGDDEHPTVMATFPHLYNTAAISRYEGLELALSHDTRNDGDFSTAGHYVQLVGGVNLASSENDNDYRHYSAEVQLYRNIWRGRALAIRLYAEGLRATRPDRIPYTEMAALGGRYTLRGFASDRFRDMHACLGTVEYHYPVSSWLQGRVFGDWGMVAPHWQDVKPDRFDVSGGFALAVRYRESTLTIQYAHSEEGGHLYIGTGSVFGQTPRRQR